MVSTILTIPGRFRAPPDLLVQKSESDAGVFEVKGVEGEKVQLTVRESENAAGVSITVGRGELELALEKQND
jgi:hypothetical protein